MDLHALPFDSTLEPYEKQAVSLLAAYQADDAKTLDVFHRKHPRFLDSEIRWLPKELPDSEIAAANLGMDDARLTLARWYDFQDWAALEQWVRTVAEDPAVHGFEAAVEAAIAGDLAGLESLLREDPELARARSTRITHFDPPLHRATLLHYVAANGVEGYRQKTPPNAVEITQALLRAGADPDALASLYGGECTVMSMLISSDHPADAGVQVALIDTLVDSGASVTPLGEGNWRSPLMTALVFGFRDAAEALVRRGAPVDNIAAAAGLGRVDRVRELLPESDAGSRHAAFALAAQLGYPEIVRLLLDAGEDPNRYSPKGMHVHATALHQAVAGGHEAVVRLLVERGARLDTQDKIWHATPLGWAVHNGRDEIAAWLRGVGR